MTSTSRTRAKTASIVSAVLRVIAAAGLVVDARIHLRLAPAYDAIRTSAISQGDLFRVEAVLAILSALLLLVPRRRIVALIAVSVAVGGLVPLLAYRYVDLGTLGPLPPMYEPAWYPDKVDTLIAQVVASVAATALLLLLVRAHRSATIQ